MDVDDRQLVGRGLDDVAVESGPARARPTRWAGLWRETPAAARSARPRARGSVFTRAKPSWPSSACEPPVRSEPAPAGGLLHAGEAILAFLHAGSSRRSASRRRSHPGLRPLANLRFEVCRLQPAVCFTQAKPSWPSSACEPPVRSVPAPAGGLLHAGEAILAFVRLRTSGSK